MHVRRHPNGERTDLLGASVAEAALILQSVRHEIIRCERRINDKQMGEETRQLEQESIKVLRGLAYHINALFVERKSASE